MFDYFEDGHDEIYHDVDYFDYADDDEEVADQDQDDNGYKQDELPNQAPPTIEYIQIELGIENVRNSRPWRALENNEFTYESSYNLRLTMYSLNNAFTSESAFNVAVNMFLAGHTTTEIENLFALGAALQIEPQTLMLAAGTYQPAGLAPASAMSPGLPSAFGEDVQIELGQGGVFFLAGNSAELAQIEVGTRLSYTAFDELMGASSPQLISAHATNLTDTAFDYEALVSLIDIDEDELCDIISYGEAILRLSITPLSTTPPTNHENIVSTPFDLRFDANDSVSLTNGASIFRQNILSLPGRGGFGIDLNLIYDSSTAETTRFGSRIDTRCVTRHEWHCELQLLHFEIIWYFVGIIILDIIPVSDGFIVLYLRVYERRAMPIYAWVCIRTTTVTCYPERVDYSHPNNRSIHGLGLGWNFDLPHILGNVLYLPGRGSFAIHGNSFVDYTLQDMRLFADTSFFNGNLRSTRRLSFYDGTTYFFYNQFIIGKRDRFNNAIRFEYANQANFGNQRLLSRIINSDSGIISFSYATIGTNRTVTVTAPDWSTFVINLSPVDGQDGKFQLDSFQNQVSATTAFEYSLKHARFDPSSKTPGHSLDSNTVGSANYALLLTQVTYPSGATLHFEYARHGANFGQNGSRQVRKVASRKMRESATSPAVMRTTFGYTRDALGRTIRTEAIVNGIIYSVNSSTFNAAGLLHSVAVSHTNGNGVLTPYHTIAYFYDPQGRLIRQEETAQNPADNVRQDFINNAANNVTQTATFINGRWIASSWYTFDRAQRLSNTGQNHEHFFTYDPNGNLIARHSCCDGTSTVYTRNLAGLITSVTNTVSRDGPLLSSFTYVYYLDGNVSSVREIRRNPNDPLVLTDFTTYYWYDNVRRLSGEYTDARGTQTDFDWFELEQYFHFDARSNRVSKNRHIYDDQIDWTDYITTYTYDLNNRLLTTTKTIYRPLQISPYDPSQGYWIREVEHTVFTNDAMGNQLTSKTTLTTTRTNAERQLINNWWRWVRQYQAYNNTVKLNTQSKTYNAFNQLTSFTSTTYDAYGNWINQISSTYTYRADGLRHVKEVSVTSNETLGVFGAPEALDTPKTSATQTTKTTHTWQNQPTWYVPKIIINRTQAYTTTITTTNHNSNYNDNYNNITTTPYNTQTQTRRGNQKTLSFSRGLNGRLLELHHAFPGGSYDSSYLFNARGDAIQRISCCCAGSILLITTTTMPLVMS